MKTSKTNDINTEKKSIIPVKEVRISKSKLIQKLSHEVNKRATERMLKDLILGK
jgi:ribosomal protein S3AE